MQLITDDECPLDEHDLYFLGSLGLLIEDRLQRHVETKHPEDEQKRYDLLAHLSQNLTVAIAGYHSSGFPIEDERNDMIDELLSIIVLLKNIDTHKLRKECNEQEYH